MSPRVDDRTLQQRLHKFFNDRPNDWIANGAIQRLVAAHTKYTPAYADRQLRLMRERGEIERRLKDGHAFYRLNIARLDPLDVQKAGEELWNSLPDKKPAAA